MIKDGIEVAAIIPARAGSQGIKKKNIRKICGLPLWMWSYNSAIRSTYIDRVIVTTDMPEILETARAVGCDVVERPENLAGSLASLDDTIIHAVDRTNFSGIGVLLQPTNPVRPDWLIDKCIEQHVVSGRSVMTVNLLQFVWQWDNKEFIQINGSRTNRQEMGMQDLRYHEDGCVYVFDTHMLLETGCRVYPPVQPMIIPDSVNIDEEIDLFLAEKLLKG